MHYFVLQKPSLASELYEKVLYHLDLVETDYFGLQFSDTSNVNVSINDTPLHRDISANRVKPQSVNSAVSLGIIHGRTVYMYTCGAVRRGAA